MSLSEAPHKENTSRARLSHEGILLAVKVSMVRCSTYPQWGLSLFVAAFTASPHLYGDRLFSHLSESIDSVIKNTREIAPAVIDQATKMAEDTRFKGTVVIGTKATDKLGQAVLKFLQSPEGIQFLWQHRYEIINSDSSDPQELQKMSENFWKEFDKWAGKNGFRTELLESLTKIYKSFPTLGKVELEVVYSQTSTNNWLAPAIDHIAETLAGPIAMKIRGGKIGTRIVENGVRRASNHAAILGRVQGKYDSTTANIRNQLYEMLATVPKKTVEVGISQGRIKPNATVTVKSIESTDFLALHKTLPKDSYYHTAGKIKGVTGEEWVTLHEGYLPQLDGLDFDAIVRKVAEGPKKP